MQLKNTTKLSNKVQNIFKKGSKTFSFAASFFDKNTRDDVAKLYSIFRELDDIVDSPAQPEDTSEIAKTLDYAAKKQEHLDFLNNKNIPIVYYIELVTALKTDIEFEQKASFEDLYDYCYGVAGTIGIMISHMLRVTDPDTVKRAERLGVAMQITNILRDIDGDAQIGRIYLPKQDMDKFGVTVEQIQAKVFNDNLQKLMIDYERIARFYYKEGNAGIKKLPIKARFGIKVASKTYEGILDEIKKRNYNPFLGRAHVKKNKKLYYLLRAII